MESEMAKKKEKAMPKTLPDLSGFVSGLGGKREATYPVAELAKQAGVSAPALAGMKTAFGWDSQTRLTQADFTEKARSWLKSSGR